MNYRLLRIGCVTTGGGRDEFMESRRATVRDLRRRNRSTLLSTLFFEGPLSRHELGGRTGLSAATVSNVVGELVDEGLVVEAGLVDSDGGRPRVLLRVNPAHGTVVGVDVGETGVAMELFDLSMTRLAAVDHALEPPQPDPALVAPLLAEGLAELLGRAGLAEGDVLGIGIGVPGTVEQGSVEQGLVGQGERGRVHAQSIGWEGVPLADLVRDAGVTAPLFVENGAKTQGQAEMWFGAGRGARHAVIALIGSGVGATVIADGATYQGSTSSAGEWGHTTLSYGGGRFRCGGPRGPGADGGGGGGLDPVRHAPRGPARARPGE